jgi:hypothetical protein
MKWYRNTGGLDRIKAYQACCNDNLVVPLRWTDSYVLVHASTLGGVLAWEDV